MDYSNEDDLRGIAALSPEEQAAENQREAAPYNRRILADAIANERDPARRRILMDVAQRLGGDSAPAPAPAAGGGDLLDRLQAMDGGTAPRARRGMDLLDRLNAVPDPTPAPPPSSFLRRAVGDTAVSALKGAIAVPEAAVGLADMATGGQVGKFLANEDGSIGFRPKEAQDALDQWYSPEQQQANQNVQQAQGWVDTAKAAVQNPSVIYHSAVQSLPAMLAGGITGRALMTGAVKLAPNVAARVAVARAAPLVASEAATGTAAAVDTLAGAVGEGVTGAGQAAEQIREESKDGLLSAKQVGMAGVSGAGDTALALLGGRVAHKLGIHDVDTMLAGHGSQPVTKGFVRSVLEGAVSEGLLEELPQNIVEQVSQNIALDKPLDEGVAQQAVLGAIVGAAMGGGSNMVHRGHSPQAAAAFAQKIPEPAGPLSRAVNDGLDVTAAAADVRDGNAQRAAADQAAQAAAAAANEQRLARMHEQAAAEAQGLRDFTPAPAPAAPVEPAQVFSDTGVAPEDAAAARMAAAEPREPAIDPNDLREATDQIDAQHRQIADLYRDVLNNQGKPFTNKRAAMRVAGQQGGDVVPVDGGFAVRVQQDAPQNIPDSMPAPAAPTVDEAAHAAATSPANDLPEPTQAQKEAGNYQKGHVNVGGLDISVENPQGSTRSGVDRDGKAWENTLEHHYGYIKGTVGNDKDHVDAFIKPGTPEDWNGTVYVVDQVHPDNGTFDEHKTLIGFNSEQEARDAYAANYAKDWKGLQAITPMPLEQFKAWVRDPEATKKPLAPPAATEGSTHAAEQAGAPAASEAVAPAEDAGRAEAAGEAGRPATERPAAAEAAGVASDVEQRIAQAEANGVTLSEADKAQVRQLMQEAHDLRRKADRTSAAGADPLNKGNAFPMGVGFTRETKRSNQRIDASVRHAGEAVKLYEAAGVKEKGAERLLQGIDTEAHKAKQAERKTEAQRAMVRKLVNHQPGDKIGQFTIERVNKDRDGYPASYTISGDGIVKGVQDKVDVAREFFGGDKAAFRQVVDAERAAAPAPVANESAVERRNRLAAEKAQATKPEASKPWALTQDEFVKALDYKKDGARWSAYWHDAQIEGSPEAMNHPDIGQTMTMGARFFGTKREAQYAARTAHKRAVRRALMNGEAVDARVLEDYPDLKEAAQQEQAKKEQQAAPQPKESAVERRKRLAAEKQEAAARAMNHEGRPTDGKPISAGDVFRTTSGRETTPFPKQKGLRHVSQWLIDNALAEAKARGDDFNAQSFENTKPLKDGSLTTSDGDSLNEYLFGEQPKVVPSILKPLSPAPAAPESAAATTEGASHEEGQRQEGRGRQEKVLTPEAPAAEQSTAPAPQEQKTPEPTEEKPAAELNTLDAFNEFQRRLHAGEVTLDEFKKAWEDVKANHAELRAELEGKTKAVLLGMLGPWGQERYRNDKKDAVVRGVMGALTSEFNVGGGGLSIDLQRHGDYETAHREAMDAVVQRTTAEDLQRLAAGRKEQEQQQEERKQQVAQALVDPKTLQDYVTFMRAQMAEGKSLTEARMMLTPEQRATFDDLAATDSRAKRLDAKREQKTEIRTAGQVVDGNIIETKHTQKGHDLFVVQLAERVSREDYDKLNAAAKRIGGYYSSFRGRGAVAGFQFKDRATAEAFVQLARGDKEAAQQAAEARRDAFEDDKSQSAAERLRTMADRLDEIADESLSRERKVNTQRRAGFAARAEAEANQQKALAGTMRNIAGAIDEGKAKFLDRVRQKAQVVLLQNFVRSAKDDELRARYPSYADYEKHRGEKPTTETADHATFPTYTAFQSDLARLARRMVELDGTKLLGQRLLKVADDVSEAYLEFAKKNELEVAKFFSKGDGLATFATKAAAEASIRRSGLADKAIVLPVKRGVNRIILSPAEAMRRGVWTNDHDKRITLSPEFATELIDKASRRKELRDSIMPWQLDVAHERRTALSRMGIENPYEFRAALREFIGLQERPVEADRVKQLERAMVGRKNTDGLDFFATPESTADEMVSTADVQPGMRVLEPSAGMGHIADRLRAAGVEPDVIEMAQDRRELLEAKGYNLVGRDFLDFNDANHADRGFTFGDLMEAPDGTRGILRSQGSFASDRVRLVSDDDKHQDLGKYDFSELKGIERRGVGSGYDRIIMNPPFSDGRDIQHVMHAYDLLKPGGRLVAIVGEGAFSNSLKRSEAFREWLEQRGGSDERLAEGTFADAGLPTNTSANARMIVIDKPATEPGPRKVAPADSTAEAPAFSRSTGTSDERERNAMHELSQSDELYALPKSDKDTVEGIASDINPTLQVKKRTNIPGETRYDFTFPDGNTARLIVRPYNPYGPSMYGFDYADGETSNVLFERPGENPEEAPPKDDVWIDVSLLKGKGDGTVMYAIAANYAHNTGKVFIGDPAGLSNEALRRRAEQMLSSALKFGTTEHLAPHPRQVTGDAKLGVPGLKWVYGDDLGNIRRLIEVNLSAIENAFPSSKLIDFDADTGQFTRLDTQRPVSREAIGAAVERERSRVSGVDRKGSAAALAGGRTVARNALLRALLREEGGGVEGEDGGRDGLLARLVRHSAVHAEALRGIFYSRDAGAGAQGGLSTAAVQAAVSEFTKGWQNAPQVVVVNDLQDPSIPEAVRAADAQQRSQGAGGEPEGFYADGKVYLVASQLASADDVRRVLFHEALGHFGLRGLYGSELGGILDEIASRRAADIAAKARDYGLDLSKLADRRMAAEEVLAEMAQSNPQLGFVRRAIAAIRAWLRDHVPALADLKLSDDEIVRELIQPAREFVQKGKALALDDGFPVQPAFSRSFAAALQGPLNNARAVKLPAGYVLGDLFDRTGGLNWWHKTVGTPHNLAQRSPEFKRVYDAVQTFGNDVSRYASEAADQAPSILPKLEGLRDLVKQPMAPEDVKALAAPVFEGTLGWARDESGKPVKLDDVRTAAAALTPHQKAQAMLRAGKLDDRVLRMWQGLEQDQHDANVESRYESQMLRGGVVWKDSELRSIFGLNDKQIGLYKEFRSSIDKSLNDLGISQMLKLAGDDGAAVRDKALAIGDAQKVAEMLRDHLFEKAAEDEARAPVLNDTGNRMIDIADRVKQLQDEGYAPLSRFGDYTLDVVGKDGQRLYFGLFESARERAKMARQMQAQFPDATITVGTMPREAYSMFAGVTPETAALFGEMLGLNQTGDSAADQAFQKYLKIAIDSRSSMKRLIQRKGVAGFSEDVGRVLAGFVYSNARQTASNLHTGEMTQAVTEIPKEQGQLQDYAAQMVNYVRTPQNEAQGLKGLLFAQYLGGSVASAAVNALQPIHTTFPYLSQWGGAKAAGERMVQAFKVAGKKTTGDAALDAALKKAEEDGIVAPQEVHQLQAQAAGRGALVSGDGTKMGNAIAKTSNVLSKAQLAWGKVFSVAEQWNRRVTYIAAYNTAVAEKIADPDAFARQAVADTQFTMNKGNKPKWARGAVGGVLFTFKQYSVSYLEMLNRMWTQGGPEGKKAVLLAIAVLFLMSGANGLPFEDDAEDVLDGFMQRLGYNFDSKRAKAKFIAETLGMGDTGAQFLTHGLSGLPGAPIDVSGRLGLGNLIPGTGLLTKKDDHTSDVAELAGPAADLAKRAFQSAGKVVDGDVSGALAGLSPTAVQNLLKAYDMLNTGMYRDGSGKKVIDVDAYDAVAKAIGFQPADVSRVQEGDRMVQDELGQNRLRQKELTAAYAQAMFAKDADQQQAVREQVAKWNADNPDSPINVGHVIAGARRQALQMNMDKAARIAKSAPSAVRGRVKAELESQ